MQTFIPFFDHEKSRRIYRNYT